MIEYKLLSELIEKDKGEDNRVEFVTQQPFEDPAKTKDKVLPVFDKLKIYKQRENVEIFAEDVDEDKETLYFLGPEKKEQ
ncbi:hypothetical protein H9Q70_002550 [Fusarium xylarioides]|nr:hypothetical protein H9Q70_002550 [Fusarium xylarioides]